jgi:hypothetical protein
MLKFLHYVFCADTRDVAATVEQVKRCVDSGAEIVRITVQGKKEAAACMDIREALFKDGYAPLPAHDEPLLRCSRVFHIAISTSGKADCGPMP